MRIDPAGMERADLYRLMISVVVPRPIAWISTKSPDGVLNAAPFSYFQALSSAPPLVMIAVGDRRDGRPKDTRFNIEATGEFVVNIVSEPLGPAMVKSSVGYEPDESEFEHVGLQATPSEIVAPPRIAASPVALECKLDRSFQAGTSTVLIGEVVLFHVADDVVLEGTRTVDPVKLGPLGRLGGNTYAPLRDVAQITQQGEVTTVHSAMIELWRELRDKTIAMTRALKPEHLAVTIGARPVGRMLRHLAGCKNGEEWDESWTPARLAAELTEDREASTETMRRFHRPDKLQRMIRHEAWHQGQIAAALRSDFGESELWKA